MEDNALIKAYLTGDYAAFVTLYERHKGGVYRYILRQLNERNKVDDLFQDTWAKVVKSIDTFNQESSFKTWLYSIARNGLVDEVRHMRVVENVIEHESDEQTAASVTSIYTPKNLLNADRQRNAINHCINKLPVHQRECFLLKEESGLPASDIAIIVNAELEATKSRIRTAYRNLRQCLQVKLGFDRSESDLEQGA